MVNKQITSINSSETLLESIKAVATREFYGYEYFPLPSYLFYVFTFPNLALLFKLVSAFIHLIIGYLSNKILGHAQATSILLYIVGHTSFLMIASIKFNLFTNTSFVLLTMSMFLYTLIKENWWLSSPLVGMLMSSDPLGQVYLLYFVSVKMQEIYHIFINPRTNFSTIMKNILYSFIQILIIPTTIYFSIIALDVAVRNRWSIRANTYSFNYQSNLQGFNINQKISPYFEKIALKNPNEKPHRYVMDRSVITIMNINHKGFLACPNDKKIQNVSNLIYFEIHKIHSDSFEDEEPRFIKNNDNVKFKSITKDVYLGIKDPKVKIGDQKLLDVSFDEFENDDDIWKVECNGYLKAREHSVQFIHVNKKKYLGCSRTNNSLIIHSSVYSDKKSRLFYIAENENHSYYIDNFEDERAREIAHAFPRYSFYQRCLEYYKSLKQTPLPFNTSNLTEEKPFKIDSIHLLKLHTKYLLILTVGFSVLFTLLALFFYVLKKRKIIMLGLDSRTKTLCHVFLAGLLGIIIFGGDLCLLFYISFLFNISFLSLFMKQGTELNMYDKSFRKSK